MTLRSLAYAILQLISQTFHTHDHDHDRNGIHRRGQDRLRGLRKVHFRDTDQLGRSSGAVWRHLHHTPYGGIWPLKRALVRVRQII